MKQITLHLADGATEEMLDLPNPRKMLNDLADFLETTPLSGNANPTITLAEATIVGIGRVKSFEARVTSRFRRDGDLFLVTDFGLVNASEMVRMATEVLDKHGK